ncbi:holin [Jeotgalibacillus campisalis]|uniref:Holin n=1 Tax=Jeotgalibacillus campisalis TaxID=220754 RepID=A0A0C2VQ53_9BACL|nr:holin [Jeotgalibacillus campisalis]KIL46143.1 holin [Jeotgalibacillus campisalis]
MTAVLIFATVIAPIVLAAIEVIKRTAPIPKNYLPLIALAVGIFIGYAASQFTDLDTTLRLWAGAFAGLSATGLFELTNKREGVTKEENE